jgi:hypothetical protein
VAAAFCSGLAWAARPDADADGEAAGEADGAEAGDALGAEVTGAGDVGVAVGVLNAAEDGCPEPAPWAEFPPLAMPDKAQASKPITPSPASSVKNRRCQ